MTSRIINEDGSYVQPEPQAPPQQVSADDLPQKQPDPYSSVDVTDFTNAATMSRVQLLTLSQIAYERGLTDIAARWKMQGVENAQRESDRDAAEKMEQVFAPKYRGEPGRILDGQTSTPWSEDQQWRELDTEYRKTQAEVAEMGGHDPRFNEASGKAQTAQTKRDSRRTELIEAAQAAGTFTEMDARVLEAQESLARKAEAVGDMFA